MKSYSAFFFLFLAVLLNFAPLSVGGKVYKWIDEKGVVHFSDRAPESNDTIKGAIEERDLLEPSPDSGEGASPS